MFILNIMNMNMVILIKVFMVIRVVELIKVLVFGSRRVYGFDSVVEGNKVVIIGGCYGYLNLVIEYKYGISFNGIMFYLYI